MMVDLERHFRTFGLFVVGLVVVAGSGGLIVYGMLWFYLAAPGGRDPGPVLEPVNQVVLQVASMDATAGILAFASAGYVLEVKRNGFWPTDDRLLIEKLDDKRKELAQKRDAWSHPDVDDTEDADVYDDVQSQLESDDLSESNVTARDGNFVVTAHKADFANSKPRVRGIIENRSEENVNHVQIDVDFLDDAGHKVGEGFDLESGFPAGGRWQFDATYMGPGDEEPRGYQIRSLNVE